MRTPAGHVPSVAEIPGADWEFQPSGPGVAPAEHWAFGPCWFSCGHQVRAVLWIGGVTTNGVAAPLYACNPCLGQLHSMAWDFAEASWDAPVDGLGRPMPLYPSAADTTPRPVARYRGRHRRARTAFGARFTQLATTAGQLLAPAGTGTEERRSS
ncbi:hypothetical protein RM844_22455 [Streptomyces sp. DSM 44915]|uniref:Uncharacterized protein n=1 Tax=Streptomyces chisholmiae TaxID=3075540 RepID=A0ABU2JVP4_9ACTN|nr:hypothetical protein [Streptomyces sp. DSM 44915]MDT0269052.1 hypothetical protein [Streptomyces sp. DSM 44915]